MHYWNGITERLCNDPINRIPYFLLRCTAYFILQPLIARMKAEIKPSAILKLRKHLSVLDDCSIKGQKLFKEIAVDCASCTRNCCRGGFDRFTVYDHITHVISQNGKSRPWSFRLRPVKPKRANITRMDENCPYLGHKGCNLDYQERPTRCIYEDCSRILEVITRDQKKTLSEIRRTLNKVHFLYVARLLAGGIAFHRNGAHVQDTYVDNRNPGSTMQGVRV